VPSGEGRGKSRSLPREILDAVAVPVYVLDREYRYIAFNSAHADLMRACWGAEIARGDNYLDLITGDDEREVARTYMERAWAGGHVISRAWFGDGSRVRKFFSVACSPIREAGETVGIVAVALDETERSQIEEELHESERRFRATFEQATIGMAQVDLNGRWIQVNRRFCEILGYSQREMRSLTFADITHPDTLGADLDAQRRLREGSLGFYHVEKRYVRKDGSLVWIDLTVSPVRDANRDVEYFIDVIEDIDDRKQAEEALRESEERYRGLVEAVGDLVFVIDSDDRVQYVNDIAARWLRGTPEELVGKARTDLFPAQDEWTRRQGESLRRVFESGQPLYVEHPVRFPDRVGWQATSLAPLHDASGRISGVVGIGRDVTQRKEAEERHLADLQQLAHTDGLTGLMNRRGFDLLAGQVIEQAARTKQGVGVVYADLDDLKTINDEYGHAAGDQALRDIATVLRITSRSADVIARIGGDEFVVLAVGEGRESIELLSERLKEGVAFFNSANNRPWPLSMSLGYASCDPGAHCDIDRLVADSDAAMYRTKAIRG